MNLHRHIVQNSKALLGKESEDVDKENLKQVMASTLL